MRRRERAAGDASSVAPVRGQHAAAACAAPTHRGRRPSRLVAVRRSGGWSIARSARRRRRHQAAWSVPTRPFGRCADSPCVAPSLHVRVAISKTASAPGCASARQLAAAASTYGMCGSLVAAGHELRHDRLHVDAEPRAPARRDRSRPGVAALRPRAFCVPATRGAQRRCGRRRVLRVGAAAAGREGAARQAPPRSHDPLRAPESVS